MNKDITPLGYHDRFTGFSNVKPGQQIESKHAGTALLLGWFIVMSLIAYFVA